jgi:magnesium transporter
MSLHSSSSPSQTTSRAELRQLVGLQLQALLEQDNLAGAKTLLVPVLPVDIAEVIRELPQEMQAIAFRLLPKDEAIDVFEYLDFSIQQALLSEFKRQEFLNIVDQMSPDDRARLFDELPAKVVRRFLEQLSPEERHATALLLGYKPNTAGRIMTPEHVSLRENWTVSQALEQLRELAHDRETIYSLYIINGERQIKGVLSLRELVVAQPDQLIQDIMNQNVIAVHTSTDQEEVAQIIQRYDLLAVPVVDIEERLVGIITVDDILDVVQQETTEDIYALGGVQSGDDNYFQTNLFTVARKRVVWLLILLITNTGTTAVIHSQEDLLEQVVALAAFIPLLIDAGGNVGAQSSTVIIRGLNTDEVQLKQALSITQREAIVGILLGIMLGIIVTIWAFILQRDWGVAITVGFSLFAISVLASVSGSALPFLFKALKFDPALMSAPFITTAVDVLGVLIYLSVARSILQL